MRKLKKKINRVLSRLNHDFKNYHLFSVRENFQEKFGFKDNLKIKISDSFLKRISEYANYLKVDEPKKKNDLWTLIENQLNHKQFIDKICKAKKDNNELINLLQNIGKTNLLWGYGPNRNSYVKLKSRRARQNEKRYFFDNLISISEYYGNIKVFNPEQGGWLVEKVNYKELIFKIFKKRNISLFKTPNYYYGFYNNKSYYFLKDLKGLYAAEQLKKIFIRNDLSEIVEIGAGIGFTCHYLQQLKKIKYTIYDLPYSSILQAIYLAISIGEKNICLDNEKLSTNKSLNKKIYIKPYWKIFKHKTKKNILWFNEDSMPEIDLKLSKKYIKKISGSNKSYFLSINQEARNDYGKGIKQHTVRDLLKINSIYRSRDFLRPGYIEELFKIN